MRQPDPLARPEELIRRVYAYVAARIGDGPDAEDVTSEAFERALRYRRSYDATKGEPVMWLLGIARRVIGERASARRALPLPLVDTPAPGDMEAETVDGLTVSAAVGRLGDREQELVALRYGSDLTARQIADLLGMRTNAVEVALHRALAHLRVFLAPGPAGKTPVPSLRNVRVRAPRPVSQKTASAREDGGLRT